jgi:hypothetical protein
LMGYITDAWETPSQSSQSSHPPIIIPQVLKTHGARSGMSCGGHVMPSGERVTAAWGWTILTHNNQLSGRRVQFNWPITSLGPWFHVIIQSGGPILPILIGFFFLYRRRWVTIQTIQIFGGLPGFDACTQMSKTIETYRNSVRCFEIGHFTIRIWGVWDWSTQHLSTAEGYTQREAARMRALEYVWLYRNHLFGPGLSMSSCTFAKDLSQILPDVWGFPRAKSGMSGKVPSFPRGNSSKAWRSWGLQ